MICAYVVAPSAEVALRYLMAGNYFNSYLEAEGEIFQANHRIYTFTFNFEVE